MMRVICPERKSDDWGSGHYGALRGDRTHNGIDYACAPGSIVLAIKCGTVTKLGYPYADDLGFRYVEVTDSEGYRARYFYCKPSVEGGEEIEEGQPLGLSQRLGSRYTNITEHIHLEIIGPGGQFVDPKGYGTPVDLS